MEDVRELLSKGRRHDAFELVLARFGDKVYRLMLSMLRNPALAEDAAQDTLLKIWQSLEVYDGRAAISTWIYTIARNTALTRLRAESYRQAAPLDSVAEPAARSVEPNLDARALMARLPEDQRRAVELFYLQERSVEDVAEMLDIPVGTVKSQLYRARKAMAEWARAIA